MKKISGFTLIEMLSVLVIAVTLIAVAVPSFSDTVNRQKANGEASDIISLLAVARSETIKRSKFVTLCSSIDSAECGGDWQDGWILFVDEDSNGVRGDDELILRGGQTGQKFILTYRAFGSSSYLRFAPFGLMLANNGTFKLCPEDGDARFARAVIISKLARTRLGRDRDGDGIAEDASGNPLGCF